MNDMSVKRAELARTTYFEHTLRRARHAAEQRSHRYVTLEHLLFALLDDPDAIALLKVAEADIGIIRSFAADAINLRVGASAPGGRAPTFSYKFDTLMLIATDDAFRFGMRKIDGALALLAMAKEGESHAAALLLRNGFDIRKAIQSFGEPTTPIQKGTPPMRGDDPRSPPMFSNNPKSQRHEENMNDVLASVRDLLDANEREAALSSPPLPAPSTYSQPPGPPRTLPPQAGKEPRLERMPAPTPHPMPPAPHPMAMPMPSTSTELAPLPPPKPRPTETLKKAINAKPQAVLTGKLVENIPRRMKVAVPEIVEVRISKEECVALFQNLRGRGTAQSHDVQVSQAMTVRLCAPDGGFFIETMKPETQWVFDRPSFLGEEAFGRWVWTIIPNERGRHALLLIVSSRSIDHNGLAGDTALPDQTIEVRVRTNYKRTLSGLFRTVFFLVSGGVLTEGALYALKLLGKLPK